MTRLQRKKLAIKMLASLKVKHVNYGHFKEVASKVGLTASVVESSWRNFVEFGKVDLRINEKNPTEVPVDPVLQKKWNDVLNVYQPRKIYYKTKVKVLRDYIFNPNLRVLDILEKYKISSPQLYELIRELNVSGSIAGHLVLDFRKYNKTDIKQVAKYNKKPHLFIDADITLTAQLERISQVLDKYLV